MKHIPPHYAYALVILIVGAAYIGSNAYFRNQDLRRKEAQDQQEKAAQDKATSKAFLNNLSRSTCISSADKSYNSYLEVNGTKSGTGDDTVYTMPQFKWDYINKATQDAKDLCLKQYPSN